MYKHLIDIVSPHYQDLLAHCEKNKIAINLDFQDLTISINDDNRKKIDAFLQTEIRRALKICKAGDKITLAETNDNQAIKISVKNSGAETLSPAEKAELIAKGYEVRARFGYDTIVTLKLVR